MVGDKRVARCGDPVCGGRCDDCVRIDQTLDALSARAEDVRPEAERRVREALADGCGLTCCPACGSEELNYGSDDTDVGTIYQRVWCEADGCGATWQNAYQFDRVVNLEFEGPMGRMDVEIADVIEAEPTPAETLLAGMRLVRNMLRDTSAEDAVANAESVLADYIGGAEQMDGVR